MSSQFKHIPGGLNIRKDSYNVQPRRSYSPFTRHWQFGKVRVVRCTLLMLLSTTLVLSEHFTSILIGRPVDSVQVLEDVSGFTQSIVPLSFPK